MRHYNPDDLFQALKGIMDLPDTLISLDLHLKYDEIPTVTMVCEAQKNVPYLHIVKHQSVKEFKFKLVTL